MRLVIQRVSRASVRVERGPGSPHEAHIGRGLLILVGVEAGDGAAEADWAADKVAHMRIFPDGEGKMNLSVKDAGGSALVISQFTLLADAEKGNRPGFTRAARPEVAAPLVERFAARLRDQYALAVGTGVFGADMAVELVNDGPVTIVLDRAPATGLQPGSS